MTALSVWLAVNPATAALIGFLGTAIGGALVTTLVLKFLGRHSA